MKAKSAEEILTDYIGGSPNQPSNSVKERIYEAIEAYHSQFQTQEVSKISDEEIEKECKANHLDIDELLSAFKRHGFNTDNWDGEEGAEECIVLGVVNHITELKEEWLRSQQSSVGDGWVSVTDRLPPKRELVIVTNNAVHSDKWVCAGQINDDGKWYNQWQDENSDASIIPTHWQPLPSPPNPTEKK